MVKGGQVGLSLRSMYMDLGVPMKIVIQSDLLEEPPVNGGQV